MRPVTQAFTDALGTSHQIAVEVKVVQTDETLDGLVDGNVTLDGTSAVRGAVDLTFIDDGSLDLIPTKPTDTLAPYGNELQVSRGITYADGTKELVSLGVFRIESVEVQDTGTGTQIRVAGLDRATIVSDAKFDLPGEVTPGTDAASAILSIVQGGYELATDDRFEDIQFPLPRVAYAEGDDRWDFAQQLASRSGAELYFDGDGELVLVQVPDITGTPVAEIAEGTNGVLLAISRRWTREDSFNRVIVTGESMNQDPAFRGDVYDNDDTSPTYYFGPFGKVLRFERSDLVGSVAQAEAAALGILNKQLGTFSELEFGAIVQPHLEPGDIVLVERDQLGIAENHIIDSLTIPLTAQGDMSANTRGQTIT